MTTQRHNRFDTTGVQGCLIRLLDGEHDLAAFIKEVMSRVTGGELKISEGGDQVTSLEELEPIVEQVVITSLDQLAKHALLIS